MDYEHILLQKKGVKVYNIPPMSSNKGHYLDSWKNKITELNIKIVAKGQKCTIHLINYDGTPFAASPIPDNYEAAVVKCVDSSRGFALKVQDPSGRSAWIGIGFTESNDSFDFQACLQDFEKTRDMELNPEKYAEQNRPTQDFSLKKGEKITFNVQGTGAPKPKTNFTGDFKLAPPPGTGSFGLPPPTNDRPAPKFNPAPTNTTNNSNNSNDFGSFGGFGSNQGSSQSQNNNFGGNQGGFGGNQGGFGGFQSWGQPQQTNTQNNANNFDLLGDINFSGQPTTSNTNMSNQQSNNTQGNFDLL